MHNLGLQISYLYSIFVYSYASSVVDVACLESIVQTRAVKRLISLIALIAQLIFLIVH